MHADIETVTKLEIAHTALREELVALWSDLDDAIRRAVNGQWSIECDNLAARIQHITLIVGPAPAREMPVERIILGGHYERLHEKWGVEIPAVDHAEFRRFWDGYLANQRVTPARVPPTGLHLV